MKVTHVSLRPTETANAAGRPALTPELLAATGARYSRSNEGLEAILAKIDPKNPDKSVDAIFKFVDYGHASIADMAPVALFIDGISMWLAYELFRISPTAGGQESSTRYIPMGPEALADPDILGIPKHQQAEWHKDMARAFEGYKTALEYWEDIATRFPSSIRIPEGMKPQATARIQRNFVFDRSRYFLPLACKTNVMLVQSARAWVGVCQHLLSHPLAEARACGAQIREELSLVAPRLIKHAQPQIGLQQGLQEEFEILGHLATKGLGGNASQKNPYTHPDTAHLSVMEPESYRQDRSFSKDLAYHSNRYAYMGEGLKRTSVRFSWDAVAFAEIRDLNRHRTGTKYCPMVPMGFYGAFDEIKESYRSGIDDYNLYQETQGIIGGEASQNARNMLLSGEPTYIYHTLLGTQYPFEHTTTANHFLYEAELRTGTGAHYRYAKHLHDALAHWYTLFPETKGLVLEGSAEPE